MNDARLPAGVEASALIRRVQAEGGFASVLHKGDPDRGALIMIVTSRGRHHALLERRLGPAGDYVWALSGPDSPGSGEIEGFVARRVGFDADCWVLELDIADAERFIAETTASG